MKLNYKTLMSFFVFVVFVLFSIASTDDDSKKSSTPANSSPSDTYQKPRGNGDSSCRYAIESRIRSIDGMHTGIEYKGDGMFMAFVASPTTNYEYKVVYFYTDSDCEITNVQAR